MTTITIGTEKTRLIDQITANVTELHAARAEVMNVEKAALRIKHALSAAEDALAAALITEQAGAPSSCSNEAQRRAHALAQTAPLAARCATLQTALMECDVERVEATGRLRMAEDTRRALEQVVAVAGLPSDMFPAGLS